MARSRMIQQKDSRLAIGLTLLFIGALFLLDKVGFFSLFSNVVRDFIMDWRNFFFYAGIIFLCTKRDKMMGVVLILLGAIFYFKTIFSYVKGLGDLIGPVILIVVGIILVYMAVKRR